MWASRCFLGICGNWPNSEYLNKVYKNKLSSGLYQFYIENFEIDPNITALYIFVSVIKNI